MKITRRQIALGTVSLSAMLAATPAFAQAATDPSITGTATATAAPAPAASVAADEADKAIIVTGVRASLRDALQNKRNTDLISDNISSKDIGQLPDVTIAEELNRLPGVNTTRDRGNASQASVRGLGPRFVFGLVNGREIASSEPSQDLRWEVYPSEVLSGATVYKAQDASLVPGGIAATIDIRTHTPLDYHGPAVNLRFGPTYNENGKALPHYSPWGYRGSVGLITHLAPNLAIALGASAQKQKNGFPDFRTFGWNADAPADGGYAGDLNGDGKKDNTTWGLVTEVKEITQNRYAYVANVGWQPSDTLTVNFDSLYSKYTISENQFQTWYGNNFLGNYLNFSSGTYNAPGSSYKIVDGTVVAANLVNSFPNYQSLIARYKEKHQLATVGLNTKWEKDGWKAILDLSHSEAKRNDQWRSIWLETKYANSLSFDVQAGHVPSGILTGGNFADPTIQAVTPNNDPSFNGRNGLSAGPEVSRDRISAVTASLARHFDNGFLSSLEVGGRLSDRLKRHSIHQYELCAGSTTSGSCDASAHRIVLTGLEAFTVEGFTAPPMIWGDFDKLFSVAYPNSSVPSLSELPLQHTAVAEKTAEAYAKLGFATDFGNVPIKGGLGVRVAQVRTRSSGFQQAFPSAPYTAVTVRNRYTDVLPSFNMTAYLTPDQLLRFGASIGISRPPLESLVTGFVLNPPLPGSPGTGGGGNPVLKPFKAKQLDISYENYFHPESLFAVALYYKHLDSFIGASDSTQIIDGKQYLISGVNNGKGGNVRGLEVTLQSRLYFLPGFLQDFGIYANYAHVSSNIREFSPRNNPYRMVGVAKHTAELDGFYSKGGFEARVALKYHSPFTVAPTWVGTFLKELASEKTLDASVSYQLTKQVGIRFQGHNLTNERSRMSSDNNPQNLSNDGGYQVYGRSYLADVSFKF